MNQVRIRRGRINDIPDIKKCLINSWVEHAAHEPELLDEQEMRASDVEGYYQPAFTNQESIILVAELGGRFTGFLRANVQQISKFFKHHTILFIDDVCVIPEFRKQGIAQVLLAELETIAHQRGVKRIQGRVYSFNTSAQRLFTSMGYSSPHATWDKLLT